MVDLLQQDEAGTRAEVFAEPDWVEGSHRPPPSRGFDVVPALRKRFAATIGKASPGIRVVQAALLIDQSRRFTGSQTWISPWLALPIVALLFAFQSLPAGHRRRT